MAINLANRHFRRGSLALGAGRRHNAGMPIAHTTGAVATAVAVRVAVAALPLRQRTALVLRYYSDCWWPRWLVVMDFAEGTARASAASGPTASRPMSSIYADEVGIG